MFKIMRMGGSWKILAAVLLSGLLVAGYSYVRGSAVVTSSKPNLILISLDTLRADRLGLYDYDRATSPFLDSWAKNAAVFEHTVSVAPWTLPSHVSMFTGLYPSSHGVTRAKKRSIGSDTEVLTEILRTHGYQNFAITAGGYVAERYGFGRGFDSFIINKGEHVSEARGFPYTVKMARERLAGRDPSKPFFLFLHTYAVHCPYDPPAPYDKMFVSAGAEPFEAASCSHFFGLNPISPANALHLSDLYDGSVRYLDLQLEKFFNGLREDGLAENTFVIVTSDHGEEFLEHGRIGHKKAIYKELLMVPLLIAGPGIKGQRIPESVSLADLFPTVLDLLKLPASKQPDGHSLWALMHGEQETFSRPPYQFSELDHGAVLRSLLDPTSAQFILDVPKKSAQLFDLGKDPAATVDIAAASPDRVQAWKDILDRLTTQFHERSAGALAPATKEQIEQLKTLGYL